jgi:hypothetical protein
MRSKIKYNKKTNNNKIQNYTNCVVHTSSVIILLRILIMIIMIMIIMTIIKK